MPPLPSTIDAETLALIDSLRRRTADIEDVQIPRLHACTGTPAVHQRLTAELREDLDIVARQIETLEMYAADAPRRAEREVLAQLVEEFRNSSTQLRKNMRAALLHSKRAIDARTHASFRAELFGSAAQRDTRGVDDKATDDALMRTTNNVTDSLRRSIGLMQAELERSVLSHQLLEQSSSSLRSASKVHDALAQAGDTARTLTIALSRTDALDRALILTALLFFVLVVLFVIQQRILARVVGLAFWWVRFVPGFGFGTGPGHGQAMKVDMAYDVDNTSALVGSVSASVSSTALGATASVLSTVAATASAIISSSSPGPSLLSQPNDDSTPNTPITSSVSYLNTAFPKSIVANLDESTSLSVSPLSSLSSSASLTPTLSKVKVGHSDEL